MNTKEEVKLSGRDIFYADLIITAIENYGYGNFEVLKYDSGTSVLCGRLESVRMPTATILFYDRKTPHEINKEVFSKAFSTLRSDVRKSAWALDMISEYNSDNYDFDTCDALNLMEIGLFGKIIYA